MHDPTDGTTRADGIVLRGARADDVDQILAIVGERLDPAGVPPAAATLADPDGLRCYVVAADGDRVAAITALWPERLRVGVTVVPCGQIDFVASLPAYGGRGLARDLLHLALARSAARGDLAQVITGIPYYYRRFGFCYVVPLPAPWELRAGAPLAVPEGLTVRTAGTGDLGAVARLQDGEQARCDVALPHSAAAWRWLAAMDTVALRVVDDGTRLRGCARVERGLDPGRGPRDLTVAEVAADGVGAARALLADARDQAGGGRVRVKERPGAAVSAVLPEVALPHDERDRYMFRVADGVALLDALRPTLSARLAASHFAHERGEVLVSWYHGGALLAYADGAVHAVRAATAADLTGAPEAAIAVPPDVLPDLLLGPDGAAGLDRRHPDCRAWPQPGLAGALFPPLSADVLSFYVP